MGRYDGEDYEVVPACRPDEHDFAMNGTCWRCGCRLDSLIAEARAFLDRWSK